MTTHTGTDPYIERTDLFIDGDRQPPLSTRSSQKWTALSLERIAPRLSRF
jgi:hypothetical protein